MSELVETHLGGVLVIRRDLFRDDRGVFTETWRRDGYAAAGLPEFVQDNVSSSRRGVLRGLHFQRVKPQGKLVTVLAGAVFDVAVDIRPDSPTFAQWFGLELSAENAMQLYIPPGFAHGFQALTDTVMSYKCTEYYYPQGDAVVRWDDPQIAVTWPLTDPILSAKDANAPLSHELTPDRLR